MKGNNYFDKMFPKKYDFHSMLYEQSKTTCKGINALEKWIKEKQESDYNDVFLYESEANKIRFHLEEDLIEAFITPFDRQDIYSISVEIDKIMDCSKSVLMTIKALNIEVDSTIISMAELLSKGTLALTEAILILESNPAKSQSKIEDIRRSQNSIEDIYISGLSELFLNNDCIMIIKYREVYNYFKEAAMFLGYTVDIYHRICVRMI